MLKWLAIKFENKRAGLQARLGNSIESPTQPRRQIEPADWRKRGNELLNAGRLNEAAECYRQGTLADPDDAICLTNLGFVLGEQGRSAESQEVLLKAVALDSGAFDAQYMLGNLARSRGELPLAIERYRKTLVINPDFDVCRRDLCIALAQTGQTREARVVLESGRPFASDSVDFYFFKGNLHLAENELDDAVKNFLRAAQLKPRDAPILINLGVAQFRQRDVFSAINTYQRVLEFEPNNVQAHANMGGAFQMSGKLDLAIHSYRQALLHNPEHLNSHQNLLYALTYDPNCLPAEYLKEARQYGARIRAHAKPYSKWLCPALTEAARPLRIGFVSGDLCNHPVGAFLENVLARVDPTRLTLVAYSTGVTEDELSVRIKPLFAEWSVVASLPDEVLASKIHSDQIDILVDLAGHTERNRLSVFAWRPAPLQVAWLGYWASTGVAEIDYILVDHVSVPESAQQFFCEKTWYLPDTRFCFTPPVTALAIEVQGLAAQRQGHITFGSFQALNKMSDVSLSAWSRILALIPSARLRLQNWQLGYPEAKEDMRKRLAAVNIDFERVDLYGGTPRDEYLAAYSEVDIILDTFPFPGGTTTAEALWMGVPTLTLTGRTLLARQGESLLRCVGLEDWVAASEQEYVDLAMAHAVDMGRLHELRASLRLRVLASPLFDAGRFSRHLEEAFAGMVRAKATDGSVRLHQVSDQNGATKTSARRPRVTKISPSSP